MNTGSNEIERVPTLSREQCKEILAGETSRPIVLTEETKEWKARSRWSLASFKQRFGGDSLILTDDLGNATQFKKRPLAEYIDYVQSPEQHSLGQIAPGIRWYAGFYSPFSLHPELLEEFQAPTCIDNWFRFLQAGMDEWYIRGFGWLLIGPSGTKSAAHFDLFDTHAWTAQLEGRKRFFLYEPDRSDPYNRDVDAALQRPLYETVLNTGELLIIPNNWCHAAVSLEPSMTLTFNFLNETNFGPFLKSLYEDRNKWESKFAADDLRMKLGMPPKSSTTAKAV
ncbi:MAG: cupin-like domain-containing protein [Bdellovibrionales bacterium]|nr:cupin-like domain-containing protein [Bdellovibrionales bacterium]